MVPGMLTALSFVALCLAGVVGLPLAGALFGFGLAWGRDLYEERRRGRVVLVAEQQ